MLHVCGISVYEGNSVTFNQFDCYLNKKWSISVKIDFKISLIMISAVSMFRDRTRLDDISYLFLGKGSFTSTCKAIYESKNVCVKKLHPTLDKEHVATFSKKAEISLLRLLRMLQRKWLSQSSEWYDCGIKNTETLRGSKDISKSNINWFSQCVLSLSSSMFVPT